jgi:GNAT superfamily N-acetyltransferase
MTDPSCAWAFAGPEHRDALLVQIRAFYEEEKLEFDSARITGALQQLLQNRALGIALVLNHGSDIGGYLIATLGFSLEFGGHFALVDELYLAPEFRGRGEWRKAFAMVEDWASSVGVKAIRLEVNHHNEKAAAIYLKYGFHHDQRAILSKWLPAL